MWLIKEHTSQEALTSTSESSSRYILARRRYNPYVITFTKAEAFFQTALWLLHLSTLRT